MNIGNRRAMTRCHRVYGSVSGNGNCDEEVRRQKGLE